MAVAEPSAVRRTVKSLQLSLGEAVVLFAVVRQNGVTRPHRPCYARGASALSWCVLVDEWPEGASCDFAKMVFTDPS